MGFRYERAWRIPMAVDDLWASLEQTDRYPQWWPWLRDAALPALTTGSTASFTVAPPLPYHLSLQLHLVAVEPARRIDAVVAGDLVGSASLNVRADGPSSSVVELRWDLNLARPALQRLSAVARPVLEWGHEMVVHAAVAGFATAHGLAPEELVALDSDGRPARHRPVSQVITDGLWAGAVAAVVSGMPSTLVAVVGRQPLFESTRAAGTLFGAPTLPRAVLAHGAISLGWGVALSAMLPSSHRVALGVGAGAAIAALDLGVLARRHFPAIAALAPAPQIADHLLYGAVVGAVLGLRSSSRPTSMSDGRLRP